MRPKAERYYRRLLSDAPPFERWPFRLMTAQKARWRTRASTVYVSIVSPESKPAGAEVHSGASLKDRKRSTRRSRARRLLFYLTLPPYRNYRSSEVKARISEGRTALDKCEIGLRFALERDLTFGVAPEIAAQIEERGARIADRHLLTSAKAVSGTRS